MAKSAARKARDKEARHKGYDLSAFGRRGQAIAIDMTTRKTKSKSELMRQHKYKKLDLSGEYGVDRAFYIS
ncbi:hypothetical protein NV379_00935 [Paenibacillus sp. N1-5-1-14]|uniref:hypothetical protein n=1 Tax=Paenibacillus radicibacter TaxID=2972488 RepID=UPI0021596733|nr:hypothetical protein [Paenibacillus radicibacter]MCR8641208.1 hypothetical protein [Paenibacillus radicibacter]